MKRRLFVGSVAAATAAAFLPDSPEPKTFYPCPGPGWKLVTVEYRDNVADIYCDGKLQRRCEASLNIKFRDTWRLWVKEEAVGDIEAALSIQPYGNRNVAVPSLTVKNGAIGKVESADKLPAFPGSDNWVV